MERKDERENDQLRDVELVANFVDHPEGSVLISFGQSRFLCNLTIEDSVPAWFRESKRSGGWITAEYVFSSMTEKTRS